MSGKYLLLVEGPDDVHVFHHLSQYYQVGDKFKIEHRKGIENLLHTLPTELKGSSDLERLGIVVDADTDLDARWAALRNILLKSGSVKVPITPDPHGTMVAIEQPDRTLLVGIWLMPDNKFPGMLEDFINFLIPEKDTLRERAKQCVDQIPEQDRRFPVNHQVKAYIHTWLAWQREPGKPLGQAITKRYLDANAPHAQQLISWLQRLFDLETN